MIDWHEVSKVVPTVMHLFDAEGDPTAMDVVRVPEGFSFQMFDRSLDEPKGYQSIIVDPLNALNLIHFLQTLLGVT